MSGFAFGVVGVLAMILLIQTIERYQDRQDYLQSRAALWDKARREGRI